MEKKLYANVIAISVMIADGEAKERPAAALCTVQIVPSAKTVIDVEIVAMDVVRCVMQSFLNPIGVMMMMTLVTVPNVTDVVIVAIVRVVTMMNTTMICNNHYYNRLVTTRTIMTPGYDYNRLPSHYICYICNNRGHHIRNCPERA